MGEIYPDEEQAHFDQNRTKKPSLVVLDAYGTNLSKLAAEGKLDPVIGREDEILRVVQILGRRRKNNPVLVGEPGVGKCVTGDTLIDVRNKTTMEIEKITISEFLKRIS